MIRVMSVSCRPKFHILKSVIIGDNGPHSTNYLLFLFRRPQLFKNWDVTAWVKHTDPYGEGILRLFFVTNFYYASNKFVLMFKNIDNTADKDLQETFFLFLSVCEILLLY